MVCLVVGWELARTRDFVGGDGDYRGRGGSWGEGSGMLGSC